MKSGNCEIAETARWHVQNKVSVKETTMNVAGEIKCV